MSYTPLTSIPPYKFFKSFTPTVPQFYWDIESWERGVKYLSKELWKLICYANQLNDTIIIDQTALKELQDSFETFMESGFDDYYAKQIEEWINANFETIFIRLIKNVFFGLSSDGYFVAYIPESWQDIDFDTGAVYTSDEYGRLILTY